MPQNLKQELAGRWGMQLKLWRKKSVLTQPEVTQTSQFWAVIAASGTAGHIYPGIAVAQALKARDLETYFAISKTGVGSAGVEQAGFDYVLIAGRGIRRSLTPRAICSNLAALGKLLVGSWQLFFLLRRLRPKILLTMGGYTGFIAAKAAFMLRIPVVTAEQNAVPGLANKLAARLSKATATSFPGTNLPKATYTGNPVRQEIIDVAAKQPKFQEGNGSYGGAQNGHGSTQNFRVVILGGSLGAGCINTAVSELIEKLADSHASASGYHIFHITGEREWEQWSGLRKLAKDQHLNYDSVPFADDMATVFSDKQLVVGRAGAGMVAELAIMGLPSILVPLQGAPGDHQTANAQALAEIGAARCFPEAEFNGRMLLEELEDLRQHSQKMAQMSRAAAGLASPDAATKIAGLLLQHAKA